MRLTPSQLRTLVLPVVLVLAVLAAVALGGHARAASSTGILGFQSDSDPTSLITRDRAELGTVGVDGINLTGQSGAVASPSAQDLAQLAAAKRAGLPALLLVGNYSDAINDFSESLAHRTLSSADASSALAQTLAGYVKGEGWSGLSIDLESLSARDRGGLTRLLADLRADLGSGPDLRIDVMNETSASDYLAAGYDLSAIARSVSYVTLMAYDQHGPWENTPGPVASTAWVKQGLAPLLAKVPASHVDLGVAGYGYIWRPHANDQLSVAQAVATVKRAGVKARWNASAGEWTARLKDGSVIWWSDSRTLALRRQLANAKGLHGLALWSLGLAG